MTRLFSLALRFARAHDDLPAFQASYVILAFLLAALLNMGAFGMLIVAHMAIDIVKYRERFGYGVGKTALCVLRENLRDIMLFSVGLLAVVYLDTSWGIVAGLGELLRLEANIVRTTLPLFSKFAILRRSVDVLSHVARHIAKNPFKKYKPWASVELLNLSILVLAVSLLIALPLFTTDLTALLKILSNELVPWRV